LLPVYSTRRTHRRRQAPVHLRDVVCAVVIFPGEVLAFQNIERQAHALRAPAPGKAADPPAAAPDFGEDDFEGEE
jgi:hypothetical protein